MNTFSIAPLMRNSVGFDRLEQFFNQSMTRNNISSSFPHYNIIKSENDKYQIILALAGYDKKNIEIIHKNNNLTISGDLIDDDRNFIYRGIASRKFEKSFELAEHVEIDSAKMENGLLIIELIKNIPAELQPKQIIIN
ncbi:MAG: Small heat shock protein IbpA [Alphaproteobacteria bacterium MarineAlpha2_Bin1]|nr:MAG: Small heat shock protein IbpA [Alphaproteobacteria bacterium MarineAlpha2_Bin1]